jgi:hypothetical protein
MVEGGGTLGAAGATLEEGFFQDIFLSSGWRENKMPHCLDLLGIHGESCFDWLFVLMRGCWTVLDGTLVGALVGAGWFSSWCWMVLYGAAWCWCC